MHIVAIGGIGTSALAKYALNLGIKVTGSDLAQSEITQQLEDEYGIPVFIGTDADLIQDDYDLVVYSPAVPKENVERVKTRAENIPEYSYPEILGKISQSKKTIAVSGTNGKTTTTSMILEVLKDLGIDPTGIVGAILQKYNSNFVAGNSDYFITEACEYKESFLSIHHDIVVITNITEDHLDFFTDLEHIKATFAKFMENTKDQGILVCNRELQTLQNVISAAESAGITVIDYSKYLESDLTLPIPGEHNKQNFAATLGVIEALGLSVKEARTYLSKNFKGAKRRMEYIGLTENMTQLFDDYAHNPEGLRYLIAGLRDFYPDKKIIMLFEPHLYSRTRDFKDELGAALELVDTLYLLPTYRAREPQNENEDFLLSTTIDPNQVELFIVSNPENLTQDIREKKYNDDHLIISAGAGDVWKYTHALKKLS